MAQDKDLIPILKLLDDESPRVRERVWETLESRLAEWEPGLRARLDDLSPQVRGKVLALLSDRGRENFRIRWPAWRSLPGETEKLEAALAGLSGHLAGLSTHSSGTSGRVGSEVRRSPSRPLAALLDGLADEFRATRGEATPTALAAFLFTAKGFYGAEQEDYHDPRNSDLIQVIERRRGLPISLACIFMLTGSRLGIEIHGCDVPEHFLTRAIENGREAIIDCFDGGRILGPERLLALERKYSPDFPRLLRTPASAEAIVARVLRNLINAFHLAGDKRASQFMWRLAEDLRGEAGSLEP